MFVERKDGWCGRNEEYALAEWIGVEKTRSRHLNLVLWSRNHKYSALT